MATMAALEATHTLSMTSYHVPICRKLTSWRKSSPFLSLHISASYPNFHLNSPLYPLPLLPANSNKNLERFKIFSAVGEIVVEETAESETQKPNLKRKLFVYNLPWSYAVDDIKNIFGECGTVSDVEIIKQKDGKNKGYAFVTMATGEAAQAVIDKFDSHEVSGRIIRIEFAKSLKKTKRSSAPGPRSGETRHKLYVSNLGWKVRSSHLKEFFAANYNPVSARVVFDSPSGRSAGYGFVSFATKSEAEAAMSALHGKELLGRPVRLKFSEKNTKAAADQKEEGGGGGEVVVPAEPQSS